MKYCKSHQQNETEELESWIEATGVGPCSGGLYNHCSLGRCLRSASLFRVAALFLGTWMCLAVLGPEALPRLWAPHGLCGFGTTRPLCQRLSDRPEGRDEAKQHVQMRGYQKHPKPKHDYSILQQRSSPLLVAKAFGLHRSHGQRCPSQKDWRPTTLNQDMLPNPLENIWHSIGHIKRPKQRRPASNQDPWLPHGWC